MPQSRSALIRSRRGMQKFNVNKPGQDEIIQSDLYDYQEYAAAGQTSLVFFQVPVGQAGKTYADTNLDIAGSLPTGKNFLVTGVAIDFLPGTLPGTHGAQAAPSFVNDVYTVAKSGFLTFTIGSKDYLPGEAPLGKFPTPDKLHVVGALSDATTLAADAQTSIDYAKFAGPVFKIIPVRLESTQNFNVTLRWPAAVALPSTTAGRIGVRLIGQLIRDVQ